MRTAILVGLIVSMAIPATAAVCEWEEGGYAGTKDQGHHVVVYNFLKHFSYNQYYWATYQQFTSWNNSYVDAMDFSIFAGHGNQYYIQCTNGGVDLTTAGNTNNEAYEDSKGDCEFIAFESCKVVPSPLERWDWWWGWNRPDSIFKQDLHMALGFRTSSYQATDQDITNEFGKQVRSGKRIIPAWFDAIEKEGLRGWWPFWARPLKEFGCVVYRPNCVNDTYCYWAAKPDRSRLCCWYQY